MNAEDLVSVLFTLADEAEAREPRPTATGAATRPRRKRGSAKPATNRRAAGGAAPHSA